MDDLGGVFVMVFFVVLTLMFGATIGYNVNEDNLLSDFEDYGYVEMQGKTYVLVPVDVKAQINVVEEG